MRAVTVYPLPFGRGSVEAGAKRSRTRQQAGEDVRGAKRSRALAAEAEKFLDAHDPITVPPLARETWRMEMIRASLTRQALRRDYSTTWRSLGPVPRAP